MKNLNENQTRDLPVCSALPQRYIHTYTPFLMFAIPKCLTHINIQLCISQTQQNFIVFIIVLGQHVSILIESSSGPQ